MILKADLPKAPRRTKWHIAIDGDTLTLQLRRTGLIGRRTVIATWTTNRLSELSPDPVTGIRHAAKGLLRSPALTPDHKERDDAQLAAR